MYEVTTHSRHLDHQGRPDSLVGPSVHAAVKRLPDVAETAAAAAGGAAGGHTTSNVYLPVHPRDLYRTLTLPLTTVCFFLWRSMSVMPTALPRL